MNPWRASLTSIHRATIRAALRAVICIAELCAEFDRKLIVPPYELEHHARAPYACLSLSHTVLLKKNRPSS